MRKNLLVLLHFPVCCRWKWLGVGDLYNSNQNVADVFLQSLHLVISGKTRAGRQLGCRKTRRLSLERRVGDTTTRLSSRRHRRPVDTESATRFFIDAPHAIQNTPLRTPQLFATLSLSLLDHVASHRELAFWRCRCERERGRGFFLVMKWKEDPLSVV